MSLPISSSAMARSLWRISMPLTLAITGSPAGACPNAKPAAATKTGMAHAIAAGVRRDAGVDGDPGPDRTEAGELDEAIIWNFLDCSRCTRGGEGGRGRHSRNRPRLATDGWLVLARTLGPFRDE